MEEATIVNEAVHAAESSGGLGTLGINAKIFLAQLINFVVVLLVLWKWAYGPIVKMLRTRSEKIENSLKEAEEIETRLESIKQEKTKLLNQAKTEASKIIDEARADAEVHRQKATEKAKQEVAGVLTAGKAQLQNDKEAMLKEARQDMVEIALAASKKVLSESIDEPKSQTMAKEVVEKMA